MPPFTIGAPLKLVIGLWAGQAKGRYSLKLRPEEPSGIQGELINLPPLQFTDTGARGVDTGPDGLLARRAAMRHEMGPSLIDFGKLRLKYL